MQYALLIYGSPVGAGAPARQEHGEAEGALLPAADPLPDWVAYTAAVAQAGALRAGEVLHDIDTATTLRVRDQRALVTDGPFAETAELLIGFYILDVRDLDDALLWAARMPDREHISVEVRPVRPSLASAQAFLS